MERDFKTNETLKQKIELCRAKLAVCLLSKTEKSDAHFIHYYDMMIDRNARFKMREVAFTNATRGMNETDKAQIRKMFEDLNDAIEDYNN